MIPAHSHAMRGNSGAPNESNPENAFPANSAAIGDLYYKKPESNGNTIINMGATASEGGGQAHQNLQPFQCVNFIIALVGLFPSRN